MVKLEAKPVSKKTYKKLTKNVVCCACGKKKKIINVGAPPVCEDCFPLLARWGEALDKHQKFMRSIAGINTIDINTGTDDDIAYMLELMAEDIAEAKMKLKQAEICMINICTMLRNENNKV